MPAAIQGVSNAHGSDGAPHGSIRFVQLLRHILNVNCGHDCPQHIVPGSDEVAHRSVRLLQLLRHMPPVIPRQQRSGRAANLGGRRVDVVKHLAQRLQQPTSSRVSIHR